MSEQEFIVEVKKLGISLTEIQLEQFRKYYEILIEWNKVMNLTGITDENQVYLKHFYDSATIIKIIDLSKEENFCDVGSGAGFPGIVIKILYPELEVTLVDSLKKRIDFLNKVIETLNLNKIKTYHARAEEFSQIHREEYDVVTARAVAALPILLEYCSPMVKKEKSFIAMKANIRDELEISKQAMQLLKLEVSEKIEFLLPCEESKRFIIKFKKNEITPKKYPRKFSEIKKKPL